MSKPENALEDVFTALAETPEILRSLMAGLTAGEAAWKPAPDRWSIAEVLAHMEHVEAHCFRLRTDQIMAGPAPQMASYCEKVLDAAGQYSGRDVEDSFDHWEDQRITNVEYLRSLAATAWARTGVHEVYGEVTLAHIAHAWAFHDLGHIRQIAEVARVLRFYAHMGPFQAVCAVHP